MARFFQSPSPYPSPARGEGKEVTDNLENDIGVDPCYDIIQNNPKSSLQSFLQTADRKWFKNIEKPKEKETDDDEADGFGNPEHGDQKTHYLIDDNPLIIFFPKKSLGIFWNPNGEKEKANQRDFIKRGKDFGKKVIDRDSNEGPQRPWGNGRVPDSKPGSKEEQELLQNKYLTALSTVGGL